MTDDLDLSREIADAVRGQERPAGFSAPPTTGTQEAPNGSSGDGTVQRLWPQAPGDVPDRDDRGPAMRASANDFAWRPQHRSEIMAHRETYADLGTLADGAVATLDPNLAANWIVRAAGKVTVQVAAPEAVPSPDPYAPTPQYLYGLKVWVYRKAGQAITWPEVVWSRDVTDPAGDGSKPSLLAAGTKDGWDNVILVYVPNVATFGYLASRAG